MRIDSRLPIANGSAVRGRGPTGARFSPDQPASAGSSSASSATSGLIGLDAVLALQAEPDEGRQRRRQAAKRGHELLDALESLKIALLSGRVPVDQLARLKRQMAEAGQASGDPRLDELLAHIELRARVEMAKLAPPAPLSRD